MGMGQEMKGWSVVWRRQVVECVCEIVDANGIRKCKRAVGCSRRHYVQAGVQGLNKKGNSSRDAQGIQMPPQAEFDPGNNQGFKSSHERARRVGPRMLYLRGCQ